MVSIEKLLSHNISETEFNLLAAGYSSNKVYRVNKIESLQKVSITLELAELDTPFVKSFPRDDPGEFSRYCTYMNQGHSLGLFMDGELTGCAIVEAVEWNRCMWIWEFHVAAEFHGQGYGRQLMSRVIELAQKAGYRQLVCETQNTNVPAIHFYRKMGFVIDGIDLSYYSNTDVDNGEIAVFMKRYL